MKDFVKSQESNRRPFVGEISGYASVFKTAFLQNTCWWLFLQAQTQIGIKKHLLSNYCFPFQFKFKVPYLMEMQVS